MTSSVFIDNENATLKPGCTSLCGHGGMRECSEYVVVRSNPTPQVPLAPVMYATRRSSACSMPTRLHHLTACQASKRRTGKVAHAPQSPQHDSPGRATAGVDGMVRQTIMLRSFCIILANVADHREVAAAGLLELWVAASTLWAWWRVDSGPLLPVTLVLGLVLWGLGERWGVAPAPAGAGAHTALR
jgi:hypothetical protein